MVIERWECTGCERRADVPRSHGQGSLICQECAKPLRPAASRLGRLRGEVRDMIAFSLHGHAHGSGPGQHTHGPRA